MNLCTSNRKQGYIEGACSVFGSAHFFLFHSSLSFPIFYSCSFFLPWLFVRLFCRSNFFSTFMPLTPSLSLSLYGSEIISTGAYFYLTMDLHKQWFFSASLRYWVHTLRWAQMMKYYLHGERVLTLMAMQIEIKHRFQSHHSPPLNKSTVFSFVVNRMRQSKRARAYAMRVCSAENYAKHVKGTKFENWWWFSRHSCHTFIPINKFLFCFYLRLGNQCITDIE